MKKCRKPEPVRYADLREVVLRAAERFGDTRFFLCADSAMPHVTGAELKTFCARFAPWAERRGLAGRHIALLGQNGAAWLSAFFAVISGGGVVVPLHLGSKTEELTHCLRSSESAVLVFDAACAPDVEPLRTALPELELLELHDFLDELRKETETRYPTLVPDAPAALYFTSGTTAMSRCVVLTHRNMGSHCTTAMAQLPLSQADTGLSVLPCSHTFEIMTNIVGALHCGGTLYINQSLRTVKSNLKKHQPTKIGRASCRERV